MSVLVRPVNRFPLKEDNKKGGKNTFMCVACHQKEDCIATGHEDGKIRLWWVQQQHSLGAYSSHPVLCWFQIDILNRLGTLGLWSDVYDVYESGRCTLFLHYPFVLSGGTSATRRSTRTPPCTGTTVLSAHCASHQKVHTHITCFILSFFIYFRQDYSFQYSCFKILDRQLEFLSGFENNFVLEWLK